MLLPEWTGSQLSMWHCAQQLTQFPVSWSSIRKVLDRPPREERNSGTSTQDHQAIFYICV